MATPFGHSLLGVAVARMAGRPAEIRSWQWYAFCAIAACAPDLDVIPGLIAGDINHFHQGVSHSLLAAVLFGVLAGVVFSPFRVKPGRMAITAMGLYACHLVLDMFCQDKRAPYGVPLFWPVSDEHFLFPWTIFRGVKHGIPGDDLSTFLSNLFSWENVAVLGLEAIILVPLLVILSYLFGHTAEHRWSPDKKLGHFEDGIR